MKVGSVGDLGLDREYSEKPFGPMLYSWCNCPLKAEMPRMDTGFQPVTKYSSHIEIYVKSKHVRKQIIRKVYY